MSIAYWLTAAALALGGGSAIWFVEPQTHADTAYAFAAIVTCLFGTLILCVGLGMLICNDAVERTVTRWSKL